MQKLSHTKTRTFLSTFFAAWKIYQHFIKNRNIQLKWISALEICYIVCVKWNYLFTERWKVKSILFYNVYLFIIYVLRLKSLSKLASFFFIKKLRCNEIASIRQCPMSFWTSGRFFYFRFGFCCFCLTLQKKNAKHMKYGSEREW